MNTPTTPEALHALITARLAESPTEPLRVPGLSEKLYRDYPAVNFSRLKPIFNSPLQYKWELENPKVPTLPMIFGSCVHIDVLEPHRLPEMIVVRPSKWKDWKTDASKEWREAQTAMVVTEKELEMVHGCAASIKQHPFAAWILAGGSDTKNTEKEVSVFRRHERTGLLLKAKLDAPFMDLENRQCIADIKKMADIREWKVQNAVRDYLYDVQAAAYLDIIGATGSFYIIACQATPPHDVDVFDLADWIEGGRALYEALLDRLIECERTNRWPGVSEDRQTVKLLGKPAYVHREAADPTA